MAHPVATLARSHPATPQRTVPVACPSMLRHHLPSPALASGLGAVARRAVLLLMVVVVVLQGFELSVQRGAGRAHVHLAQAAALFVAVDTDIDTDTDHERAHAQGLAHDHDAAEAGVLYLDEDRHEPAPSNPLPQARDLDKLLPAAAPRALAIERDPRRDDAAPLIRSVVIAPAERPPAA